MLDDLKLELLGEIVVYIESVCIYTYCSGDNISSVCIISFAFNLNAFTIESRVMRNIK